MGNTVEMFQKSQILLNIVKRGSRGSTEACVCWLQMCVDFKSRSTSAAERGSVKKTKKKKKGALWQPWHLKTGRAS